MNTVTAIIVLLAGIALIVIGAGVDHSDIDTYSGKVVFESTEEYQQFKRVMAHPDVEIIDIRELSSEPPMIVSFEIDIPEDSGAVFTYAEPYKHDRNDAIVWQLYPFIGAVLIIVPTLRILYPPM